MQSAIPIFFDRNTGVGPCEVRACSEAPRTTVPPGKTGNRCPLGLGAILLLTSGCASTERATPRYSTPGSQTIICTKCLSELSDAPTPEEDHDE